MGAHPGPEISSHTQSKPKSKREEDSAIWSPVEAEFAGTQVLARRWSFNEIHKKHVSINIYIYIYIHTVLHVRFFICCIMYYALCTVHYALFSMSLVKYHI